MTGAGWLLVLVLIGFFSLLTIKLAPIYMQNYTIKTVLASLEEEPLITKKSVGEIRKMITRRLKVNGVYEMDKDAITITRDEGVTTVDISYEVQENMAGNIDVLVFFSDSVELVSN
jgi:hypothetical protein